MMKIQQIEFEFALAGISMNNKDVGKKVALPSDPLW